MNEQQRYDELMNDLPLPDQEAAWQKMKEMLDKENNDRMIPPVLLRSCAIWGLALLMLIAAWWLIRPEKLFQNKTIAKTERQDQNKNSTTNSVKTEHQPSVKNNQNVPVANGDKNTKSEETKQIGKPVNSGQEEINDQRNIKANSDRQIIQGNISLDKKTARKNKKEIIVSDKNANTKTNDADVLIRHPALTDDVITIQKQKDSVAKTKAKQSDKILIDHKDSVTTTNPVVVKTEEKKINPAKKKKLFLSAGIGLQQQISVDGQTSVPYDYYAKKNALTDYIPSVYLRLQKENKWFFAGEFRYGAPQSVKAFSYSRHTVVDTGFTQVSVTNLTLKKTYYHQLPLSFNYFVRPNWSVGAGAIYGWFHGAIIEKEVNNKNLQTQNETLSRNIVQVPGFTDSFLYKTQIHLLLQTEYEYKRVSFALRYSRDLEPYIKYTKPNGDILSEKNQSLEFILRFRLWRTKPQPQP